MLSKVDIQNIIDASRMRGEQGLENGQKASLPELHVDFLSPPEDFLGRGDNPAIFVNQYTFNFLGKFHKNWVLNQTIAVKEHFLFSDPILIIGIVVHETGHAFNIAAKISNTEANAYNFEIDVLTKWYKTKHPILMNCSKDKLQAYFESRLTHYQIDVKSNSHLAKFVEKIKQKTILDEDMLDEEKHIRMSYRFTIPSPNFVERQQSKFFKLRRPRLCSDPLPLTSKLTDFASRPN